MTSNLYAAEVSLTWNANTEADLAGYNIYQRLLPSNDYGAPIFSGYPSNPSAPQKTITNLQDGRTYGFVATAFDFSGNESPTSDEAIVTVSDGSSSGGGSSTISVNFQPATASVPSGYQKDDGSLYSNTRGYGWSGSVTKRERNRHPDQRLDTFVYSRDTRTWKYDLPNGDYLISLASGDPSYAQGPPTIIVEGITLINQQRTSANQFHTITDHPITVSDGQLTLQLASTSSGFTLVNYVIITPVGG